MRQVQKDYEKQFLLEPTKLRRIVDTIHDRLQDHQKAASHDTFEAFLTGNRREELTSVDDVLALDNSRRHRIRRLLISCSASVPGASRPEHAVEVDFASPRASNSGGTGSTKQVVSITVRSDSTGWANRTLSEVEEQVERTWLRHARPLVALVGLLLAVLIVLGSQVLSLQFTPTADTMWLKSADLDRFEALLGQQKELTEQDLRTIATTQLRNITGARQPGTAPPRRGLTRRALLLVISLVVVLGCIVTLLATCYPGVVFLWGDEVERYANTLQRRKVVWGFIIAATIGSVLAGLFFEGVMSWFPPPP